MPQLNKQMATPQISPTINGQLLLIGQQSGLAANEFAIVEDSVLLDGAELLARQLDIVQLVHRFTEPYIGVTVVLTGDLPSEREISIRKQVADAGGSCYFRTASENFEQVVELARARMLRLRLAGGAKLDVAVAAAVKERPNPDELKSYCYTPDEQAALRQAYESDEQNGLIVS